MSALIAVTAVWLSSCTGSAPKTDLTPDTVLRSIQARVHETGNDNLLRNVWAVVEVDDPDQNGKTPFAYFISSGPEHGELMFSTTKSDDGYAVLISWLSNKNYPRKNVSRADLSIDGRSPFTLSSCISNMCDGVVPSTQPLFKSLREGRSLTFSIDVIDPATKIERTVPLTEIGPVLNQIEKH
jgi:hypothetical protein